MIRTVYIENQIASHPRTAEVLARLPDAQQIPCERYQEIFNPKNQSFRLQKQQPALIIAHKTGKRILSAPAGYGIGGEHNYYFSHMLNCIYDCRYCFLQGMYPSANYVLFINYEDFFEAIDQTLSALPKKEAWFFSGYDCDSLALEPITGFVAQVLRFIESRPRACVELRTKSTQIRSLIAAPPNPNVVAAFTLSPAETASRFELKAPALTKRLQAMHRLAHDGWLLGLRCDPLIFDDSFEERYRNLFRQVFSILPINAIHSVTLGVFRMPKRFFHNLIKLYPDEPLFAGPFYNQSSMVSYRDKLEQRLIEFCTKELSLYIEPERVFSCETKVREHSSQIAHNTGTVKTTEQ